MDGFIATSVTDPTCACAGDASTLSSARRTSGPQGQPDVMGYHDAREIPNYWTYADDVRPPGPACSRRPIRGRCRRTCSSSRRGRPPARNRTDPMSCRSERRPRGRSTTSSTVRRPADLRVDRHHVPAARARRELGVLRRRRDLRRPRRARRTKGIRPPAQEPAARLHDGPRDHSWATSRTHDDFLGGGRRRARCPRCRGSSRATAISEHPRLGRIR